MADEGSQLYHDPHINVAVNHMDRRNADIYYTAFDACRPCREHDSDDGTAESDIIITENSDDFLQMQKELEDLL